MREIYKEKRITQGLGGVAVTTFDLMDEFEKVKIAINDDALNNITTLQLENIGKVCKKAKDRIKYLDEMLEGLNNDMTPTQTKYSKCLVRFVKGVSVAFSAYLDFAHILYNTPSATGSADVMKQIEARKKYSKLTEEYLKTGDELTVLVDEMAGELNK